MSIIDLNILHIYANSNLAKNGITDLHGLPPIESNAQCAIKPGLKPIAMPAPPSLTKTISITTRIEGKFAADQRETSAPRLLRSASAQFVREFHLHSGARIELVKNPFQSESQHTGWTMTSQSQAKSTNNVEQVKCLVISA